PTRPIRHDGDRQGEVIAPNDQDHFAASRLELMLLVVRGDKALATPSVGHLVAGRDQCLALISENRDERLPISGSERVPEPTRSLLDRREPALVRGPRGGSRPSPREARPPG